MSRAMTPAEAGPRIAEVYLVVGPLYRRVLRTVERDEAVFGVSVGVRAVLDILRANGPMTVPELGREQALSRQFVQRMVNDAIARKWVRTTPNPSHKRSPLCQLTASGRRRIDAVVDREHRIMGGIGGGITSAEVDTTLRVLEQMLELLEPLE